MLLSWTHILRNPMAEQEVIKHTKKVYSIWTSDEHSLWHKVKEFFLEIFIIVFAVSLSIWLHEWSEHNHQQKEVKSFLIGLKGDLLHDIQEMEQDRETFQKSHAAFKYLTSIKLDETLNTDSVKKYQQFFFNNTGLNPNTGRFEGFKSSGKIGTIENEILQNDILDLYQEDVTALVSSTDYYSAGKNRLNDYYNQNVKRLSDSTDNMYTVLTSDIARNLETDLCHTGSIIERYDLCINKSRKIVNEIDEEYKH